MKGLERLNYIFFGGAALAAYILYKKPVLILPIGFGIYMMTRPKGSFQEPMRDVTPFKALMTPNSQSDWVPTADEVYVPKLHQDPLNKSEFNVMGHNCMEEDCEEHNH